VATERDLADTEEDRWHAAVGYLHGIRKTDISTALAKNRSFIRRRLMGQAEEPMPGQQTSET
jgi:hypothetical protein